jgi:NAD(P)-dependent dehydrogenase (short-subunit alcohol dehydrogenase family)
MALRQRNLAIITGGSSGIGLAMAKRFVQRRAPFVIAGRPAVGEFSGHGRSTQQERPASGEWLECWMSDNI